ncbi:ABC transporter ATP-binding protein [Aquibacillus kalidii]|uniref:ABC transporter ATP-binding protein n=1 Tax=Aquibacillus kalidii TaxID=2762597 RepID=UPI0016453980|nr:energy-coupling factor transporter ATPase [Aquibacillus kalidii]
MTEPIIQVSNLSFRYPGANEDVLTDVNVTINKGDFTAIIGSNGSGKSTFCKSLNGLIPHYYVGDYDGTVGINGKNTIQHSVAEIAANVGYVYQDFENQLVRPRVYDELVFSRMNFGFIDYHEKASEVIDLLNLHAIKNQYIWQLSGGQKHMVALASVLTMNPEIIIVDEPSAQLDPNNAVDIYKVLKMLNEQYGKTIIVIEHHTEFIANYCNQVLLMNKGELAWKYPVHKALNQVTDLLERNIFPPQVTQAAYQISPERYPYPITVDEAAKYFSTVPQYATATAPTEDRVNHSNRTALIDLQQVSHTYKTVDKSTKTVLENINLSFYEDDRVALVGGNGAGKSTLQKMLTGIQRPGQGSVLVLGRDTKNVSPEELSEFVTYIYQEPEKMFIADNIREDISYFLKSRDVPNHEAFVNDIIKQFHLEGLQDRDGRLLSGGQQRRASLAIGMAMRPEVILLDEPTASLDVSSRKEMIAMLEKLKKHVRVVIIATHDMELAAEWANRIVVMKAGQILADTNGRELFNNPFLMKQTGLKPPQITELSIKLSMQPSALHVTDFCQRLEHDQYELY